MAGKLREISHDSNSVTAARSQLSVRRDSDAVGARQKLHRSRTSFTAHQLDQLETGDDVISFVTDL